MSKKKRRIRHHVNPLSDLTEHSFNGFTNQRPIIIDVGADHGEFVAGLLKIFKEEKNFIVFEIRKPLANKLRKQFANYSNIKVFDGDANRNFKNIVQPCLKKTKIEKIFINFPDPWFKARHKKRRFINEKFLKEVQKWMPTEVEWIFQTDQEQLFLDTLEIVENSRAKKIDFFQKTPYNLPTKWEQAKVKAGVKIYRMSWCG
jgi:tRNA (guanine-N7-)-methyltransferase